MKKLLFVLLFLIGCATTKQDISQDRGSRIIGLSLGEPIQTSKEIMNDISSYISYSSSGESLGETSNKKNNKKNYDAAKHEIENIAFTKLQKNNNKNYFTVKYDIEANALDALNSNLINHKYEWKSQEMDVMISQSASFYSTPSHGFLMVVDMNAKNKKHFNNKEHECKQFDQITVIKDYDTRYRTYVLNKVACRKLSNKTWYVQKKFFKEQD